MTRDISDEQRHRAEQIIRRWSWASQLSVPADRAVEQSAVGAMAVALLDQLLDQLRDRDRLVGEGFADERYLDAA